MIKDVEGVIEEGKELREKLQGDQNSCYWNLYGNYV
jgi:hypothetical protein